MVVPARRWFTVVVLIAWVALGPIGMALDSCAAMMALCDGGPCGVATALIDATPSFASPSMLSAPIVLVSEHLATQQLSALEPPPKPARLSA